VAFHSSAFVWQQLATNGHTLQRSSLEVTFDSETPNSFVLSFTNSWKGRIPEICCVNFSKAHLIKAENLED